MMALIDPLALMLVLFGSLALATAQHGLAAARDALALTRQSDPAREAAAADRLIHAAEAAVTHRGLFAAETLAPQHGFLRQVLAELADARSAAAFGAAVDTLCAGRLRVEIAPERFWSAIADAAPALGMIGTVAGMIGMADALGDPAAAGPSLALALTSTLYGLVLSACIATPLAERARRRAEAGDRWRRRLSEVLTALVARETQLH